jgi:hypothetical protein
MKLCDDDNNSCKFLALSFFFKVCSFSLRALICAEPLAACKTEYSGLYSDFMSQDYKSISTGVPKIVADRASDGLFLGAPAGPPKILGSGSHTGGPKTPPTKNISI